MDIANKEYASNASNDYAFRNFFLHLQALKKKLKTLNIIFINKHSWQINQ